MFHSMYSTKSTHIDDHCFYKTSNQEHSHLGPIRAATDLFPCLPGRKHRGDREYSRNASETYNAVASLRGETVRTVVEAGGGINS